MAEGLGEFVADAIEVYVEEGAASFYGTSLLEIYENARKAFRAAAAAERDAYYEGWTEDEADYGV